MNTTDRKAHWERIYQTKQLEEVGWFQIKPETSLAFFKELKVHPNDRIIDIGGGDSFLVDHLLDMGYANITVLDISNSAIERAKKRLGDRAKNIKWIISDVLDFIPEHDFDVWHDRAAFHFLIEDEGVENYAKKVSSYLKSGGKMILGTFSESGPKKCSGITIRQYTEDSMHATFGKSFNKTKCIRVDHLTPSNTSQNFLFCCFNKS